MVVAILAFVAIFILIGSAGLLLFYREAMMKRISDVINPEPQKKSLLASLQKSGFSVGDVVQRFDSVIPKSELEVSVARQKLTRAGYRSDAALRVYNGSMLLVPLTLCIIAAISGLGAWNPFFVYAMCLAIGYLAPGIFISRRISKRQHQLKKGLPDVLDLLVICIEAGLSLDQATVRAAEELTFAQPQLCDELTVVVLEQRAGRPRGEAWKNLADRTDVDSIRNLVSMLVQSEQFGTSVGKTLRTHSDTLRTKRMQEVEEAAAKTTIKLIFPLVFFIFPSLFLIVLGPSAIIMVESFKTMFK